MRRARRIAAFVLAAVVLAVVAGTLLPRPLLPLGGEASSEPPRQILLIANPIHTDIALPLDADVLARFSGLAGELPVGDVRARWLMFGWGGRSFYIETPTWADLKPMPLMRALTLDRSVMHVQMLGDLELPHPQIMVLTLDAAGFAAMLDHIDRSFVRDSDGRPDLVEGESYGALDRFYEAHGRFNALVGCNVWTAAALREGGLRTGWWNPLPLLLEQSVRLYNPEVVGTIRTD